MKISLLKQAITPNINISALLILLFFSSTLYAQEVPKVNVTLKLKVRDGDLKNSQITITKKGEPFKVIDPDKGANAVDLPLGFEYVFTFTKKGYNTKSVVVDTHVPEHREKGQFAKQVSEVELEKQSGDQPIAHTKPIAWIVYSMSKGDFDFDRDFAAKADKTQIPLVAKQSRYESVPASGLYKPIVRNKEKKIIQEDYRKLTIITVNINGKDCVYKKEEYSWGGVYYYKEDKNITESTFNTETQ